MLACGWDGRPYDRSTNSLRRSAGPMPHARRVTKSGPVRLLRGLEGCPSVGETVWGSGLAHAPSDHGTGSCSCSRTTATPSTNGPMRRLTHPRTMAGYTNGARRRAFPSRSTAAAGAWWGSAAAAGADGLPTAQRAEAGCEGRHEGDLRTEVENTERRRSARLCRSFCAPPLTEEPQVSPLPAEGLMVRGDERHIVAGCP